MKPDRTCAASLIFLISSLLQLPAQNVLTNGSFEFIPLEPGIFGTSKTLTAGSTNLPGWTIGGPRSLYLFRPSTNNLAPVDGAQYIDFNGATAGITLAQTFPTIPDESYEVGFTVGWFQSTNPFTQMISVEVLSSTAEVLASTNAFAPRQRGWGDRTRLRFQATAPFSTLRFTDTNASVNIELVMDHVVVERVTPRLSIECSHVRVCWDSQTNRQYQLQFRSTATSDWIDLGAPIPGTGAKECRVQEITETQRLFRVVTLP